MVSKYGVSIEGVTLHLPVEVRGFTDYSCSKEHGENASLALFGKSLVPESFPHYPMGYSGRPSSIVVSGTPIRRPCGVYKVDDKVEYGTCKALDYELEVRTPISNVILELDSMIDGAHTASFQKAMKC